MGKYRYARANGEQLPSRFVEQVQSPVDAFFTTLQAYDLNKDFVSGSDVNAPSFIVSRELSGYVGKNLVGWYRLGNEFKTNPASIKDSSGNAYSMVPRDNAGTYVKGATPSPFISRGSITFDDANSEGYKTVGTAAGTAFSFSDGSNDVPFSVSIWFKPSSGIPGGASDYIVGKGTYSSDVEWFIRYNHTNTDIKLYLYDTRAASSEYAVRSSSAGVFAKGTWHHLVVTYDGRGGSNADDGITIYHNGSLISTTGSAVGYIGMVADSSEPFTIASADGQYYTEGDIAEVAVWGKVLTAAEVSNLYGVSIAGAYRLVRNFDQVSPENDTRLLGVVTRGRGYNVSSLPSDTMEGYRQGVNVKTFEQLLNYTSFKIRPNSGFVTTLRGKDVPRTAFNAELETSSPASGSAQISLGGVGRVSARLSHERDHRDLGQTNAYDSVEKYEAFEDIGTRAAFSSPLLFEPIQKMAQYSGGFVGTVSNFSRLDPIEIINTPPNELAVPRQLVIQTSDELSDGAIEPLVIRQKIDLNTIEQPFFAHDFRASLSMTDAYRRSLQFTDGWDLSDVNRVVPFLDTVEVFGATGSFGGVALPGHFSTNYIADTPFVDYANDRDKEYTTSDVSPIIAKILIVSASFEDADIRTHDKMAAAGFVFDNDPIGIDSIAYGGLKK